MIPKDFPTTPEPGSISGYQPKLLVRLVDGQYLAGWSAEELEARFDNCNDLVNQLTAYCRRKLAEQLGLGLDELLPRVRASAESKGWDVTPSEMDWIMSKLSSCLSNPPEVRE